jgi:hypothetical protein
MLIPLAVHTLTQTHLTFYENNSHIFTFSFGFSFIYILRFTIYLCTNFSKRVLFTQAAQLFSTTSASEVVLRNCCFASQATQFG